MRWKKQVLESMNRIRFHRQLNSVKIVFDALSIHSFNYMIKKAWEHTHMQRIGLEVKINYLYGNCWGEEEKKTVLHLWGTCLALF